MRVSFKIKVEWKKQCNALLLQVVEKLIRGLAMEDSKNLFSLFEHNSFTDRALESRVIVADVLAKFERYLNL